MDNISVIITAGGTSSRYGNKNKLLENLGDKTVIEQTVSKFLNINSIDEVIIVANISIIDTLKSMFNDTKIKITQGGNTRQESVLKGLCKVSNDYVLIHDGARPIIDSDTILKTISSVKKYGAVSVMTKTTDTIKEVDENGQIIRTIDRSKLYNTQTPQGFKTELIKDAHEKLKGQSFTDDASMLEELNVPVFIIEGDYKNIKITTISDLDFAKLYV